MKPRTLLCAVVAIVAAAGAAGMAGNTVRIKALTPIGTGITENPDGDGMVKVRFSGLSDVEVHLHLHHFLPNTTYGLFMDVGGFGGPDDGSLITTNSGGNANINFSFNGFLPTDNVLVVIFRDQDNDNSFSDLAERRAIGMPD